MATTPTVSSRRPATNTASAPPPRRSHGLDAGHEHAPETDGPRPRGRGRPFILLNVHTQRTFRTWKPLVIRIDDVGHAAAVSYDSVTYTPQAPELEVLPRAIRHEALQPDPGDGQAVMPSRSTDGWPTRRWTRTQSPASSNAS